MPLVHRKYDDGIAPIVGQDSGKNLSGQNNNVGLPVSNLEVNGYVLVKVYSLDSKWKNFIAHIIIDGPDEDGDFEAIFLKRSIKVKNRFFSRNRRPHFDLTCRRNKNSAQANVYCYY